MALSLILSVAWILMSRIPGQSDPSAAPPAPRTGFRAPDFTLTTLDGETVTLGDLQGQAVLINFWATWCPPCRFEMPAIQKRRPEPVEGMYDQYKDGGFVVLAVMAVRVDEPEAARGAWSGVPHRSGAWHRGRGSHVMSTWVVAVLRRP